MVSLLESCLLHDLKPTNKDQDPPHAKIACEVVSCIFLNHSKKSVMCLAVPVAVRLLHRGNRELSRNLSSYLSLAAINNGDILAPHIQPIIDSIISGNYSLVRVLPKIYVINKDAIHDHIMGLVCLLPQCDTSEKSSLLNLFALISKNKPTILEYNLPQLSDCLTHPQTAYTTMQIFLDMAHNNCKPFLEYINKVIASCEIQSGMISIAAEFLGIVGKHCGSINKAQDCVRFLVQQLSKSVDLGTTITLLRQTKTIAEVFPSILPTFMPTIVSLTENSTSSTVQSYLQQLNTLNSTNSSFRANSEIAHKSSNHLVNNLSSLKSTFLSSDIPSPSLIPTPKSGKLAASGFHILHRSIPRLHVVSGGQMGGQNSMNVHRSLTQLLVASNSSSTSRHGVNRMSVESVSTTTPSSSQKSASSSYLLALQEKELASKSPKNVASSIDSQLQQTHHITNITSSSSSSSHYNLRNSEKEIMSAAGLNSSLRKEKNSTLSSGDSNNSVPSDCSKTSDNRMSVFEPYPMRDAVQHFSEKHKNQIKAYMQKVFVKIPQPVKITIEEKKSKKVACRISFSCQCHSENCLYAKTYFVMKTKNSRIWIHLMFLALQARASTALCTREPSVNSLKNCWETLKLDNRTFLTLVTSSFPSAKDQEILIEELRSYRYFDVFKFNAIMQMWNCFLCNHPDKANGFLKNNEPVIEGQLKEKKGKWFFRRWSKRTRYFTLSGIHLYRDEVSKSLLLIVLVTHGFV